jgi:hypothetical protein
MRGDSQAAMKMDPDQGLSDARTGCINSLLNSLDIAVECKTGIIWMSEGG